MSVTGAPATARLVTRGNLPIAKACVLIFAAAIVGLVLGGSIHRSGGAPASRPPPAPQAIVHGGLRLQVPKGWVRGDAVAVLGFSRPLGLRTKDDSIRATVELLPATSATLLPAAFLQTLKGASERPEVVRLASGRHAWRYRFPEDDGSVSFLYAAPTTSGVATVACLSPIDGAVPRGCEAVANAITVPGSRPLEPGTSAAFYSRLTAAVSDLDAARAKGTRELTGATRSTGQAAAAGEIARAHRAAGAGLASLTTEGDGLPSTTVGVLKRTATAYETLASAARARSPRLYADAGRAVTTADADLRLSMKKVAAAANAASRTAGQAESTAFRKPAARTGPATAKRPAETKAKSSAKGKPATSTSRGFDLSLPLLALLGLTAIVLAIRQMLRTPQ